MPVTWTAEERAFLDSERLAHLATVNANGSPHVVPICFAFDGTHLYSVIDRKPKRVAPGQLRRALNIGERSTVSLVVDRYSEDWKRLGFLLISGMAEVIWDGELRENGIRLLRDKYPQYREMALDGLPVICVTPVRRTTWGSVGAPP